MRLSILAVALLCAMAQAQPIEVKGVALGASMDEVRAKFPAATCAANGCLLFPSPVGLLACSSTDQRCYDKATEPYRFGPVVPSTYRFEFQDGKLARVAMTIDRVAAPRLTDALIEKYGAPTSDEDKPVQNRMGAKFSNRIVTWNREDGLIRVEERGAGIDKMSVVMESPGFAAFARDEAAKKAKEAAGKL